MFFVFFREGKGYGHCVRLAVIRLQGKLPVCHILREYQIVDNISHGGVVPDIFCPVGEQRLCGKSLLFHDRQFEDPADGGYCLFGAVRGAFIDIISIAEINISVFLQQNIVKDLPFLLRTVYDPCFFVFL